jgi:hypothetical protein
VDDEDRFHLQLAKTIQAWLWIESELYLLYAMLMRGANTHLVSATFNNIQSVDAKLGLLNSCFTLVFTKDSEERKTWKTLFDKVEKLNKKRNKVVHEPVSVLVCKGVRTVSLGPSHFNALALVKGQTTHLGGPVVSAEYDPKNAKLLQDHRLDLHGLTVLNRTFKSVSFELRVFRERVSPVVSAALRAANKAAP